VSGRHSDLWVVAVGGNALADPHDPRALAHQGEKATTLARSVVDALLEGRRLVVVHGNGPQVGARLIQSEAGRDQVPALPLHILVAETQGQMGHQLALAITAEAERRGRLLRATCLVTHVVVDRKAPEFKHPDKPVGPTYDGARAERLATEREWVMREVAGRGFRRVVPSPRPLEVVEHPAIERLVSEGACVIAGGGGGIPIARGENGLVGVDAVVDKDYTAERIATGIGAARLLVLTDVPGAALSFGKATEEYLRVMTVAEAREHLARGEFGPGSMAPKIEGCVEFVEAGGEEAVIAATEDAAAAFSGDAGTRIAG
jgi:carbamate kinase